MGIPKIRFKGYTEDWEQRKLGEVVEKYEDSVETPTEGYMRLGIRSHAKGTFHNYVEKGKELETAKMFRVAADKFIVNITFGWEHAVAITDENDAGKLVSHRFPQYSFNEGMVPKFFRYLILDENFKHHLELSSPGGAGRNRVLKLNEMLEYKMSFPSEEEQKKIASYFDNLDNLITLHQRKCEETKKLKKYMLQKMFPQNDQLVPKIRFAGFTEDWEQRKLEDFGKATGGTSIESEFSEDGIYKVISIGSYSENSVYNDQGIRAIKSDKTSNRVLNRNDLTMILNDKTTSGNIIGRVLLIEESGIYVYNQRTERIEINLDEYDPVFLYEMLNAPNIREKIIKQAQGNTQIYVNWTAISLLEYMIPSKEEQVKIGEYLHSISNLITLHQRKCDELQNMKKYMLQNMFV